MKKTKKNKEDCMCEQMTLAEAARLKRILKSDGEVSLYK